MPRGGPDLAWNQEGLPGGGTTSLDSSKLKKEDLALQAEAHALLVAGGEFEVRTSVWARAPPPRGEDTDVRKVLVKTRLRSQST